MKLLSLQNQTAESDGRAPGTPTLLPPPHALSTFCQITDPAIGVNLETRRRGEWEI